MSFPAAWLDLREPADRVARDPALLASAAAHLGNGWAVDLGCGTGATARAFGPGARWRLVDRDEGLLAEARARLPDARVHALDLGGDLVGVTTHVLVAQRLVSQHLAPPLGQIGRAHV